MNALLEQLIHEQAELTAVERFEHWRAASAAQSRLTETYRALLPAAPPDAGQQYAFEVDLDKCSGCKACVVACHTLNGLGESETWRKVGLLTSTSPQTPIKQHVTTACHHCVDPGCLRGCPVLAYEKDPLTGIVRHLDDQCFGCKYCTLMCPYEVPQYSPALGIVRKCDMCSQRLAHGEAPACVQACPTEAIKITLTSVELVRSSASVAGEQLVATAPASGLTLPTTRFVSQRLGAVARDSQLLRSRETMIDTAEPGHHPLAGMLVLTQASVGAWIIIAGLALTRQMPARYAVLPAWMATALGIAGVHLALLHLGRPWLAFRSFLGWRTSWLSREAIAFGVTMPLALASAVAATLGSPLFSIAAAATAALGAVAVVCSAMIYVATGRRLWSAARTLSEFIATSLGLGLAINAASWAGDEMLRALLASSVLCGCAFVPKWSDWRRAGQDRLSLENLPGRSGRLLQGELARAWRSAWGWLAAAVGIVIASALVNARASEPLTGTAFVATWSGSALCMLAAQWTLRWLAFASVVFPRMPGAKT